MTEFLKEKGSAIFILGAIAVGIAICAFILFTLRNSFLVGSGNFASVATLILVGLGAFIGMMNVLSVTASSLGIVDTRQPFGLPEGTVRAILTISFIVLVGVLASFLLTSANGRMPFSGERIVVQTGIARADADALAERLTADGLATVAPSTADPSKFDVQFFARQDYRLADDVSKQVLTILATILAAMIGFYFGARPSDAPARAVPPSTEPSAPAGDATKP